MHRFLHPLFALLLSLLLVGGQQAALAHMLGHAAASGTHAATQIAQEEDAEHGAVLALSHVCTTCIAFAGTDAAPPAAVLPLAMAVAPAAVPAVAVSPAPTLPFRAPFLSRAPPLL